jgi:hypothetical protein
MSNAPPTQPPRGVELLIHPVVVQAMDDAWNDSCAADPLKRHEEGGWIYLDLTNGDILIRKAVPGGPATMGLSNPPVVDGAVVVGTFHTHPNPSAEGWDPRPSERDGTLADRTGVPWLIRADIRSYVVGPDRRRGGLGGGPGYPP